MTEAEIQTAIVVHFRKNYDGFIVAVPNGGKRGKLEAKRMKEMGVLAGHPDLIIYTPGGRVYLMEVKKPGETLSDTQRKLIPKLQDMGFDVATVWSSDEGQRALAAWGLARKPPHERSTAELRTGF